MALLVYYSKVNKTHDNLNLMEYIIYLNKFDIDLDKIKNKLKDLGVNIIERENNYLIGYGKLEVNKAKELQEVKQVIELFNEWKEFDFKTLQNDCLKLVKLYKIRDYVIKTNFLNKIPISAKSIYKHINPYLKHEEINPNESSKNQIYIQIKKENNKIYYRIGYSVIESIKVENKNKFIVILENPRLSSEVSDFLRLCWIFKLKLLIITDNKDFNKILKKAKEETKGIDYENFELEIINEIPKDLLIIGFSKHSKENETRLLELFRENKNYGLLFGNDTFGLTQKARDRADYMIKLTEETKKPLRASHALSYIMGIYYSR